MQNGVLLTSFACSPVIWISGTVALLAVVWLVARSVHYHRLVAVADTRLEVSDSQMTSAVRYIKQDDGLGVTAAELGAYGAITSAEFVWSWAAIDPGLVAAADFASTATIHNGFDFAWYVHQHYDCLSSAAKEGFLNRLAGYYAEQQAADALAQAGHVVQFAETANQPVWDLVVDGHLVNVKDVIDIGSIKADALAHQDVTFLVPQDAHGAVGGNVVHLPGFSHDAIKDAVHDGIGHAHGQAAMDGFGLHIPFITIGFSAYRNIRQVIGDGKDVGAATNHFLKESLAKGTGVVVGGKLGGAIGTAVCPGLGTAIGAIIGALGGGLGGGVFASWWKCRPLAASIKGLEQALAQYGQSFAPKLQVIREYVETPLVQMRRAEHYLENTYRKRASTFRYFLWPDSYTVLLERSLVTARRRIFEAGERISAVRAVIRKAEANHDWRPLGLLMATDPNIRAAVGSDARKLAGVDNARKAVHRERSRLNPHFKAPV